METDQVEEYVPGQEAEQGKNQDQPKARHTVVGCPEMIAVNNKLQERLEALEEEL